MSITSDTSTLWSAVKHSWSNVGIYCGNRPVACLSILDDAMEETQDALEAEMDADAAFIVRACNSFEQLVAALKFYAREEAWREFSSDALAAAANHNTGSELGDDSGQIARAALAAAEA